MNPFTIIFYSSLVVAIAILLSTGRSGADDREPWLLINVRVMYKSVRHWMSTTIHPRAVRLSLTALKSIQNHLQSIRRRLRHTIIRLSDIDEKHSRKQNFASH